MLPAAAAVSRLISQSGIRYTPPTTCYQNLPAGHFTACTGEVLLSTNLVISMYSCITCKFNFPCWLKGPIIMLQTAEEGRNDIQNDGAHIPAGVFI